MGWIGTGRLPGQCEVCRRWGDARLCAPCIARFAPVHPRCLRCGLRQASWAWQCGHCVRQPMPFARTVCAVDYAFPWDRLITAFKFGGHVDLADALAARLHDAVDRSRAYPLPVPLGPGSDDGLAADSGRADPAAAGPPRDGGAPDGPPDALPDAVVPVPLSRERLAERGYNQAWELARRLGRRLRCAAWPTLLVRPLDTPHQVALDRDARAANLRGAFVVDAAQRSRLHGRHVALVDDVMTTGATLREAALALRQAGAARVDAWALARTSA